MKSIFDTVIDRRNTNSLKWNHIKEGELAMGIADMDFQTAPCVQRAIQEKAAFGIFGYAEIPERYYQSYQNWWAKRHHFQIERDWMLFSSGVVPAISSIVRKLTTPAEKVVVLAPVYNIFYNSILNNGRVVVSSNLLYENGEYEIDFADLEEKLKDAQTTMMIFCNPHNPIGKVWNKDEMKKVGDLCAKHHVIVISDEIHCDLIEPGLHYSPFASANEVCNQNSITCLSASKAFNLAGLQSACIVIANEAIRHRVWRGFNTDEIAEPNTFACEATIAAFDGGEVWLDEVSEYLSRNRKIAKDYIERNIPLLHVVAAQATYLLWIECKELSLFTDQLCQYLKQEKQLYIASGCIFGKNGEGFLRINMACPQKQLLDGLQRLKEGVEEFASTYLYSC